MPNSDKPAVLGKTYTDSISGFTGVATVRSEYLFGCVRVQLENGTDGKLGELWVDEQRLTAEASATSGGSYDAPPSRDPSR